MPNPRLILGVGFLLVTATTIWFGLSVTSFSQNVIRVGDNNSKCPPAITVLASTCDATATATRYEYSTIVHEITSTIVVEAQNSAAAEKTAISHPDEDADGQPTTHGDEDLVSQPHDTLPNDKAEPADKLATTDEDTKTPLPNATESGLVSPTEEEHPVLTPTDDENFNLTEALTEFTCYPASRNEAQGIAFDTKPSVNFNVVRGDNVVLSRKSKVAGQDFKTWYSVGKKPNAGCWTFEDRFGRYEQGVPRFLRSLGSLNKCNEGWKKAVVVRLEKGQSWNMNFIRHLRSLINEAGWVAEYHVYILTFVDGNKEEQQAYLNDVIPEPFRPLVKLFNNEDLQSFLGSEVQYEKYEGNSHVAVQKFMHDNPQYEFVWFVDSKTRYTGRWDLLLKSVEDEYAFHREIKSEDQDMPQWPDLVTFDATRVPDEEWEPLEWQCMQFFKDDKQDGLTIRRSLGVMGGYSRRMVEALGEVNSQKINCHSDYFAPTVASYKDLTTFFFQHPLYTSTATEVQGVTVAVSGNDATTVQQEKVPVEFSYSAEGTDAQEFFEEWVNNGDICRPEALIHPVAGQY